MIKNVFLNRVIDLYPTLPSVLLMAKLDYDLQEDAERLLKNSKRYDLLNDYYQSHGEWDKVSRELYPFAHH